MTLQWQAIGIFCEDLREERNGQEIIVGTMPDNIAVGQMPALLPKLGLYIRIHLYPAASIKFISTKIRFPDKSELQLGSFNQSVIEDAQMRAQDAGAPVTGLISRGVLSPLNLPMAGRVLAIVEVDGQELVCAALNVSEVVGPNATASGKPVAQSQPASQQR